MSKLDHDMKCLIWWNSSISLDYQINAKTFQQEQSTAGLPMCTSFWSSSLRLAMCSSKEFHKNIWLYHIGHIELAACYFWNSGKPCSLVYECLPMRFSNVIVVIAPLCLCVPNFVPNNHSRMKFLITFEQNDKIVFIVYYSSFQKDDFSLNERRQRSFLKASFVWK